MSESEKQRSTYEVPSHESSLVVPPSADTAVCHTPKTNFNKNERRSTYEVPSNESSLIGSNIGPGSSHDTPEVGAESTGEATPTSKTKDEAKEEILRLLEQRVEERSELIVLSPFSDCLL